VLSFNLSAIIPVANSVGDIYTDLFLFSYSYKLFFQVCVFLEFLGECAVKVVTVRNCYMH
jgi:hypothetical protein